MISPLLQLTREIHARRDALLHCYNDEDLHQLRVNIRRLRALLRYHHDPGARTFRQRWGEMASTTNAARDWDTLADYVRDTVGGDAAAQLYPALNAEQAMAQQAALTALQSTQWSALSADWQAFLARHTGPAGGEAPVADVLAAAEARVLRAWRRARKKADSAHWHKLRIAIKDLRYCLDTLGAASREAAEAHPMVNLCKLLQQDLGDWHDTVIHEQMLRELDGEVPARESAARHTINALCEGLRASGRKSLDSVREQLGERVADDALQLKS